MTDYVLAALDGLPRDEQRAWIGWFAGGKTSVIKWGDLSRVNFGKHECEQVDFDSVWLGKFVELGWLTVREVRRFEARGMVGQQESVEYELKATDKGLDVREGYWERVNLAVAPDDQTRRGWALGDYDNGDTGCPHCGRSRLCLCANGKHRCEKCNWSPELNGYAPVDD